jgi:ligand-binding sensor protein
MPPLESDEYRPGAGPTGRRLWPTPGAGPTTDNCAALLDPALWQDELKDFALATGLAVMLTDARGRLLGECILPHSSQRRSPFPRPTRLAGCPFSPATPQPCSCIRDALTGSPVVLQDGPGLMHFAVALSLGVRPLGVLLAGQVPGRLPKELAAAKIDRLKMDCRVVGSGQPRGRYNRPRSSGDPPFEFGL